MTSDTAPQTPFPCPFCRSSRVQLLGGGLVFHHYRCAACAEVWTAMAAARPAILKPDAADLDPPFATEPVRDGAPRRRPSSAPRSRTRRKEKLWLN